jgi:hypothetical protein
MCSEHDAEHPALADRAVESALELSQELDSTRADVSRSSLAAEWCLRLFPATAERQAPAVSVTLLWLGDAYVLPYDVCTMSVTDVVAAGGLVVTAVAAGAAVRQLRDAKEIARWQFMLAVDESLERFDELRHTLAVGKTPQERHLVQRYVGALERIGLLLEEGHISLERVDELYGSRLEKLLRNDGELVRFVVSKPTSWHGFIYLWAQIRERRPSLPAPPPGSTDRRRRGQLLGRGR